MLNVASDPPEGGCNLSASEPPSREAVYHAVARLRGKSLADRLVPFLRRGNLATEQPRTSSRQGAWIRPALSIHAACDVNPSYAQATELLTTYWSLEEATVKSERTLMRHLVEDGHPWSATVRNLIGVRHNYGEMVVGDSRKPCIIGTVIRSFSKGRLTPRARVCRWGERDLIAEADAGRTRPCRPQPERYRRRTPRMSAYTALKEQAETFNWVMIHVGRSLPSENKKSRADLYADIPKQHVLNALHADLIVQLERSETAGHNLARARSRNWLAQWLAPP